MGRETSQGTGVRDPERYEELRLQGYSKEMAARVANSARGRGGSPLAYEHWTKRRLYAKARDLGIRGRSTMSKGQLIQALRYH